MKEGRRIIEVAFNVSECLYGEFMTTCEKNRLNPADMLRKLIGCYVIAEYIKKKGCEKMYNSNNHELSWSEQWDITKK